MQYDGTSKTPIPNPTGLQDSSAVGMIEEGHSYASVAFSTSNYWAPGPVELNNSANVIYPYLQSYKSKLEEFGSNINDISLILISELENLGCALNSGIYYCTTAPDWFKNTSFWSGTAPWEQAVYLVQNITSSGSSINWILNGSPTEDVMGGIRPVITVSASDIKSN